MTTTNNEVAAPKTFTDAEIEKWVNVRFTPFHTPILSHLLGTGAICLERVLIEEEEPEEEDFDTEEEFEAACVSFADREEERYNLHGYPVAQNTMFYADFDLDTDMAIAAGFVVYTVEEDIEGLLPFDTIIGIDGGGYNLVDAHFRPLREAVNAHYDEVYRSI